MPEPQDQFDPYEDFGPSELTPDAKELILEAQSLLHKVFAENEHGKKLLAEWFDLYVMQPIVVPDACPKADGMREGKAHLVRHIIKTIGLIDRNYDQPKETPKEDNSDD